jgi:muramoyltetrapeptide carboxypeptidase
MLKPKPLERGALVGVVAPASPVRQEFLEQGLFELTRLGFRSKLGRSVLARRRYTAGSVSERVSDLMDLWEDPEVSAVVCARGGYGGLELLDQIDPERLRARPKVFLGSSDATALLLFLTARAEMVGFHGPMVAQQMARGETAYDRESLRRVTGEARPAGRLSAPGARTLHPGTAEGVLLGGCLSLVASLVGTAALPSFNGALLFLEDTGVKPYQIDRMLRQLRLAGCLAGVKGIIFGEMPGCEQHPEQGYRLEEVLADLTADLKLPVLFGFPSGHCDRPALTLPFGVRARLSPEGLSILEAAVE